MFRVTHRTILACLVMAVLGSMILAGCKKDEPASPSTSKPTVTTETAAEETPATEPEVTSPETSAPATPPAEKDGRYFAYLTQVTYGQPGTIVADYAQMLTGDAALAEAKKRGIAEVPNDFLILNDNTKLRTLPLRSNATVMLTSEAEGVRPEGYAMGLQAFAQAFTAGTIPQLRQAPFWITVKGGAVSAIEEQYLP